MNDWGDSESSSTLRRLKAPEVVRDDWEDEDEEEEAVPVEERNKKLWEKANTETAAPMSAFIISSSSPGSMASPPPVAAFKPALKILKRPVNSQPNTPSATPALAKESLGDREARYQAARQRIFGNEAASATSETISYHLASKKDNRIMRNPRGPEDSNLTDGALPKGFEGRVAPNPNS
ncbi:hypothetical protein D9757_000820 [Collybiopsis confluens]|uniref:SUZ domain-containing protein n=1 Tax=Collybiopsis confluens TaxID=2823264 RepID=A0A8H5I0G2_9AGAR|nr:hypothetical protein D9757_000820 [Collybiopsis confluens]